MAAYSALGSQVSDATSVKFGQPPQAPVNCPDWRERTSKTLRSAQAAQSFADSHRQSSIKSHEATRSENREFHGKVHMAFMEKIDSTKRMVDLLRERIRSLEASISLSKRRCVELQEASNAKKAPLQLCSSRLDMRHRERPRREAKRDGFEISLDEEKQTLVLAQKTLNDKARRTDLMIQDMVKVHAGLMEDLKMKTHALHIDLDCVQAASSMGKQTFHAPCEELQEPTSASLPASPASVRYSNHPEEQENRRQIDTMDRLRRAKKREEEAQKLREDSEALMQQTEQQCIAANGRMNEQMNKNISELQNMIQRVRGTIHNQEDRISKLVEVLARTADEMASHNAPCDLLRTRMNLRAQRFAQENIHDPVKDALDKQAATLQKNLSHLEGRQENEKQAMAQLQRGLAEMNADLFDKAKALETDLHCKNILKVYDMSAYQSEGKKKKAMARTLAGLGADTVLKAGGGATMPDLKIGSFANRWRPPANTAKAPMTAR